MSDFLNFIEKYRSGEISAFDLYDRLPLDMKKSVDNFIGGGSEASLRKSTKSLTAPAEEDEREEVTAKDVKTKHGKLDPSDKEITKNMMRGYGGSATPGPVTTSAPSPSTSPGPLRLSMKARQNHTSSRYGTEVVRKSHVGSRCTHCQRLHKSISKVCNSCRSSMSSTAWHQNSHLE